MYVIKNVYEPIYNVSINIKIVLIDIDWFLIALYSSIMKSYIQFIHTCIRYICSHDGTWSIIL